MERRALGKGISALIAERESMSAKEEKIIFLKPNQIKTNPFQPREDFDDDSLAELTQSIKEKGILQPVLVRRKGDYYELIAGERRFRAATILNLEEIPAILKDVEDQNSLEIALIENIQRQDLNPIEEARAYQYLIEKFNLTQEKVSEMLGKSRVSITNTLRLLKLPLEIQEEVRKGRLSFAHGRALLELDDPNHQRRMAQEVIGKNLPLSVLENMIKLQRPGTSLRRVKTVSQDPLIAALEEKLQHALSTKVRINKKKKRGNIVVEFYSDDDMERIVNKIARNDNS